MKVELPGGNWADIKPVEELKAKDKIAVERVVTFLQPSKEGDPIPMHAGIAEDMQIAMLCKVITAWSFPFPLPAVPEDIEDLDIVTYNALCEAIDPHMQVVRASPNSKTNSA